MSDKTIKKLTKDQWIRKYGGKELLAKERLEVVPCTDCQDTICHGWKVIPKSNEMSIGEWITNYTDTIDEARGEYITFPDGTVRSEFSSTEGEY
jgi:hypothetical protein